MDSMAFRADPEIWASQTDFRTLLESIARPGTIHRLVPPSDMDRERNAFLIRVAETTLDREVAFAVAGAHGMELGAEIQIRTGARASRVAEAAWLLADGRYPLAELNDLPVGTLEFPDQGATAVLAVELLSTVPNASAGQGLALQLAGPGIRGSNHLYVWGLSPENLAMFMAKNTEFPLGIDIFLIDEAGDVAALPRTVRLAWEAMGR